MNFSHKHCELKIRYFCALKQIQNMSLRLLSLSSIYIIIRGLYKRILDNYLYIALVRLYVYICDYVI